MRGRFSFSAIQALLLLTLLARRAGAEDAGAADAGRIWASCMEHVPPGAMRPALREQFPARGTGGYALPLVVTVEHGKGDTVLPQGFRVQSGSDAARAVGEAGFAIPDPDGGSSPNLTTTLDGTKATTVLTIPFVALPQKPGRNGMTLPPVPIAMARASGELLTLCTQPHDVMVEDPTASVPEAMPRPNPPLRSQREEWTLAKQLTLGALAGGALAALVTWLVIRQMRKPKAAPPPPPPRPPWEVAFEELFAIRHAGLVGQARFAEHFDRVSDAVRKYLGGRYGFDGLETTTDEMASVLRRIHPPVVELSTILGFLAECDLVKFARLTPTEPDCEHALELGEHIVSVTRPETNPHTAAQAVARPA